MNILKAKKITPTISPTSTLTGPTSSVSTTKNSEQKNVQKEAFLKKSGDHPDEGDDGDIRGVNDSSNQHENDLNDENELRGNSDEKRQDDGRKQGSTHSNENVKKE